MAEGSSSPRLIAVPVEVLRHIVSFLTNRDQKNLRLTCSVLRNCTNLWRRKRVFFSPHLADLRVYHSVANHDEFRSQITEVVWAPMPYDYDDFGFILKHEFDAVLNGSLFVWFIRESRNAVECMRTRVKRHLELNPTDTLSRLKRLDIAWPEDKQFEYYWKLAQEQQQLEKLDKAAELQHGIVRFPSLRRITVSAGSYGWLYEPLYETPEIRSQPPELIYPMRRYRQYPCPLGYVNVFYALADMTDIPIKELVYKTNGFNDFGIDIRVFTSESAKADKIASVLDRMSLTRLDLSILLWDRDDVDMEALRSGTLHDVLSKARELKHFSLCSDMTEHYYFRNARLDFDQFNDEDEDFFTPLDVFIPLGCWPDLRHLGLSHLLVKQDDLVDFLRRLPSGVRSVELSFLVFEKESGSYADLLDDLVHKLRWPERDAEKKIQVAVSIRHDQFAPIGLSVCVDKEVEKFLYHGGTNPFRGAKAPDAVEYGVGIEKDALNPSVERPYFEYDWYSDRMNRVTKKNEAEKNFKDWDGPAILTKAAMEGPKEHLMSDDDAAFMKTLKFL